jgi:hypothetical protein
VITAAASKTDHRNSNLVAGANVLREGWKGDVNRSGGGKSGFKKTAAGKVLHSVELW